MSDLLKRIFVAVPLILIILFTIFFPNPLPFFILSFTILTYILIFEWPNIFEVNNIKFWLLIPIYLIIPLGLIAYTYTINKLLILYLLITVAINDTFAYLIGKFFGKHKLAPQISPGKTWEGFFAGAIAVTIFNFIFLKNDPLLFILLFSLLLTTVATAGDLFESYLKRKAGIKDSGKILGAHGGVLDRIDAYLFAIFIVYAFQSYILKYS